MTLTIIMLLPLIGAAIIAAMPAAKTTLVKQIALVTTLVVAIATIVKALSFDTGNTALQFRQSYSWIPSFAINWAMGVDGIGSKDFLYFDFGSRDDDDRCLCCN